MLSELAESPKWLLLKGKKKRDERLRDEETVLRFFAFYNLGAASYRTPLKQWLNDAAQEGRKYSQKKIHELSSVWHRAIDVALIWFDNSECFRRTGSRQINKALFDLVMNYAIRFDANGAKIIREEFRNKYFQLLQIEEFNDLIGRAVDHTRRTKRRFEIWEKHFSDLS
ncbi:MAG: hypothetical protein IPL47_15915 [Phyllobacteriaceae bacterium]|nr:hypothetical protein [Phyllobacteriaceae bacterium]